MNLYTFKNKRLYVEFQDWLRDNCFRRYAVIRVQDNFSARSVRKFISLVRYVDSRARRTPKRTFHSVCDLFGKWDAEESPQRGVNYRPSRKRRDFGSRFSKPYLTNCFGNNDAISVRFDTVPDLVHCKLRWSDDNYVTVPR